MDVNISSGGKFKFKSYSECVNKVSDVFQNQIYSGIDDIDNSNINNNLADYSMDFGRNSMNEHNFGARNFFGDLGNLMR